MKQEWPSLGLRYFQETGDRNVCFFLLKKLRRFEKKVFDGNSIIKSLVILVTQ